MALMFSFVSGRTKPRMAMMASPSAEKSSPSVLEGVATTTRVETSLPFAKPTAIELRLSSPKPAASCDQVSPTAPLRPKPVST